MPILIEEQFLYSFFLKLFYPIKHVLTWDLIIAPVVFL